MHIEFSYSNKTKFAKDLEQLLHLTNVNIDESYGLYHADTDSYIKINNHSIFFDKRRITIGCFRKSTSNYLSIATHLIKTIL